MLKKNIFKTLTVLALFITLSACGELGVDPYGNLNGQLPGTGDTGGGDTGGGDTGGGDTGGGDTGGGDTGGGDTGGGDTGGGDTGGGDTGGGDTGGGDTGGGDVEITNPELFKPFAPELYFGRSKLNIEEQKAYDVAIKTVLSYEGKSYGNGNDPVRIKVDLEAEGVKGIKTEKQLFKIAKFIVSDDARTFHIEASVKSQATGFDPTYARNDEGGISYFFIVTYMQYKKYSDYIKELNLIEKRVAPILAFVTSQPSLNEGQKARILYEKYLAGVSYGSHVFDNDIRGSFSQAKIVNNKGQYKVVCQGFASSYLYLLQRSGIAAIYTAGDSPAGKHAWNKVRINGEWYNADPTWDDYNDANSLESAKTNFMKSDTEFSVEHGATTTYEKDGVTLPPSPNSLPEKDYK